MAIWLTVLLFIIAIAMTGLLILLIMKVFDGRIINVSEELEKLKKEIKENGKD